MSATIDTWTGRLGLLAGVLAVAAWFAITGRPADAPEPPAHLRLGVLASGELDISPLGKPMLATEELRAGGPAESGTLRVRNQTPRKLAFAVRTTALGRELDRVARIELRDGDTTLLDTTLARSRAWTDRDLELASGETRELEARVWIPKGAPDEWQAGRGDVTIEFSSSPGRRS